MGLIPQTASGPLCLDVCVDFQIWGGFAQHQAKSQNYPKGNEYFIFQIE